MQAGDSEASASGEKANVRWLAPCQQALCADSTPLRQVYISNSKCSEREVWAAGGRKLSREDRTWSGHRNYVETWGLARPRVSPAPKGHRGRPWEQKGPWAEEAQRS